MNTKYVAFGLLLFASVGAWAASVSDITTQKDGGHADIPEPGACLSECYDRFDCAGQFPDELEKLGTVLCNEQNVCELELDTCPLPTLPSDCWTTNDKTKARAPCAHVWFCYECFVCGDEELNPNWKFVHEGGIWEEYEDGTAKLTGVLMSTDNHIDIEVDVELQLSGRTNTPPEGFPYFGSLENLNASAWYYFTEYSGVISASEGTLAGLRIPLFQRGNAFQIGMGANIANAELYGAYGGISFNASQIIQSHTGECQFTADEDHIFSQIQLELDPACRLQPVCTDDNTNLCTFPCPPYLSESISDEEVESTQLRKVASASSFFEGAESASDKLTITDFDSSDASGLAWGTSGVREFVFKFDTSLSVTTISLTEGELLPRGGGQSTSVSVSKSEYPAIDALYMRIKNTCGAQLHLHRFFMVVDGANLAFSQLNSRFLGTSGGSENYVILNTGIANFHDLEFRGEVSYNIPDTCNAGDVGFTIELGVNRIVECEPPILSCVELDFEDVDVGTLFTPSNQPYSQYGVTISAIAPHLFFTRHAMIFDTTEYNSADPDLAAPNKDFNLFGGLCTAGQICGPGTGIGGKKGAIGQNKNPLGNILIISTDNNPSRPNDYCCGGDLIFTFATPVTVMSLSTLDIEEGAGTIICEHLDGTIETKPLDTYGDNGFADIFIGRDNVVKLTVRMTGSGGVPHIRICGPQLGL